MPDAIWTKVKRQSNIPLDIVARRARDAQRAAALDSFSKQRSTRARNRLWLEYTPLVRHVAGKLAKAMPRSVEVDELTAMGHVGLHEAIGAFDPSAGVEFATFAAHRIRGAILDGLRKSSWMTRAVRDRLERYEAAAHRFSQAHNRTGSDAEVEASLRIDSKEASRLRLQRGLALVVSLDTTNSEGRDGSQGIYNEVPAPNGHNQTAGVEAAEIRALMFRGVSKRERIIITRHYYYGEFFKVIGKRLGLSESRVCQIHREWCVAMRRRLAMYRDDPRVD